MENQREIFLGNEKFISLKDASDVSGYAKDYVGYLCRTQKVPAKRFGRDWFVSESALISYKRGDEIAQKDIEKNISENIVSNLIDNVPAAPTLKIFDPKNFVLIAATIFVALGFGAAVAGSFGLRLPQAIGGSQLAALPVPFVRMTDALGEIIFKLFYQEPTASDFILNQNITTATTTPVDIFALKREIISELSGKGLVTNTIIEKPTIVERAVERVISGISQSDLDAQLNIVNNKLLAQVADLKNLIAERYQGNFQAIALSNKIDQLNGTSLSNISFSGTVSGLTDAHIPDSITASNYLPLAGGTITGDITITGTCTGCGGAGVPDWQKELNFGVLTLTPTTTIPIWAKDALYASSTLTVQGLASFTNATATQFTVTGNSYLDTISSGTWQGNTISALYGGTGTSTYNAGDILYATSTNPTSLARLAIGTNGQVLKITAGLPSWDSDLMGSGGAGAWATTTDSLALYPADTTDVVIVGSNATTSTGNIFELYGQSYFSGKVGVGTTSPYAKLSVVGQTVAEYFTATSTTATSTFPYLAATQTNIGTVVGGTWQGSTISDAYINDNITASNYLALSDWYSTTTSDIAEGTNLYYTDARVGTYISGSSTVPHVGGSSYGDLLSWSGTGWETRATSTIGLAISDTTGTLGVSRGGTGAATFSYGLIYSPGGTTALANIATSSLGLLTTDVAEGTNQYWTNTRFDNRLSGTTTLPNLTTLLGLQNASTSLLTISTLASTTNLIVSGVSTTTGLAVTGNATSTFSNGLNLSAGCFAVNGVCVTGGGSGTFSWTPTTNYGVNVNSTNTPIWFKQGLQASSTSYFANATTSLLTVTGPAYFNSSTTFNGVEYLFPNADGSANQVLTTNAAGGLTWATASGSGVPDWQKETNFGVLTLTPTTTIPIWAKSGIYASSTLTVNGAANFNSITATSTLNVTGLTTLGNASTSLLTVSNLASTTDLIVSRTATSTNLVSTNATLTYATSTNLYASVFGLNSEYFTDLTGTGLQNTGGVLTLNAAGDWTGTFDGQEGSYYLDYRNHTNKDWSFANNFGAVNLTASTSMPLWLQAPLYASSTLTVNGAANFNSITATSTLNVTGLTTLGNASTSLLSVSGTASTTNLVVSGTTNFGNVAYTWPNGDGVNGQVLATNGAGSLSWASTTPGTSITPSFYVHRNGTATTSAPAANTYVRMDWTTERFDTNNNFDLTTDRFQPTVAGKYLIIGQLDYSGADQQGFATTFFKNGSLITYAQVLGSGAFGVTPVASAIVDMNGTTDYVELYTYTGGTSVSIGGASTQTYFTGSRLDGGSNWTDNGATTYLATGDNAAIGTSTSYSKLSVWATSSVPSVFSAIDTASTTLFTIMNGGNVGIGTTSPYAKLSVSGSGVFENQLLASYFTATSTTATSSIAGIFSVGSTTPAANALFSVGTSTAKLFIDKVVGTVMIGATTDFADTYGPHSLYIQSPDARNLLALGNDSGTTKGAFYINNSSYNEFQFGTITNSPFGFYTNNGTPQLSMNPNGGVSMGAYGNTVPPANGLIVSDNLGVGTTSPYAKLSIHANATETTRPLFVVASSTASATTTSFVILNNGNVGIGTNSPQRQFDLSSELTPAATEVIMRLTSADPTLVGDDSIANIEFYSKDLSASRTDIYSAIKGIAIDPTGAGAAISGSANEGGGITFYTAIDTVGSGNFVLAEKMRLDQYGNLGIGTTTPWRKLSVTGTVGFSSSLTAGTTGNYMCLNTSTWEVQKGGASCSASSIRFKENVVGLSYGLDDIMLLNPVSFTYKPETNLGVGAQIGFIAEDLDLIIPEVVTYDKDGLPESVDYAKLTSLLVKGFQETVSILDIRNAATSSQTLLSYYSATGTPAIYVDAAGNVGIGTTTPDYKLTIDGEAAAKGFINISTRDAKKDIVYLNGSDEATALEKINQTNLATYNYSGEECDESGIMNYELGTGTGANLNSSFMIHNSRCARRLGLIAEEAPIEVLSIDGRGVDLYKMTSFAWLGLKAQQSRIENLELRIEELEEQAKNWQYSQGVTSTDTLPEAWNTSGGLLAAVVSVFQDFGIALESGIVRAREFVADSITAKKLCLDDICVTREELKQLLDKNQIAPTVQTNDQQPTTNNNTTTSSTAAVTIVITGNNPAILQTNDIYGDLGAIASTTDAGIVALGVRGFQNGTEVAVPIIDTSTAGTHEIVYKIIDGNANILAEAVRTVIVEAPPQATNDSQPTTDDGAATTTDNGAATSTQPTADI